MMDGVHPGAEHIDTSLRALRIGGTEVHYYVLCPRKLWWFSHGMEQEHVSGAAGAENVALGTLLHETSYPDRGRKNILIDDLLRLDFTESGAVHEVKKSRGAVKATRFQLLYYLYYLKRWKGVEGLRGQIDYPKLRETKTVELTPEREREIEEALAGMREVVGSKRAPEVGWMKICGACSYAELCWG